MRKQAEDSRQKAQGFFTLSLSPVFKAFADLDTPNPEIDAIWREEAQERWQVYKAGEQKTVSIALPPASMQSYEAVMQKYL